MSATRRIPIRNPGRLRVLVTGASGFVGRVLVATLREAGIEVLQACRSSARGTSLTEGSCAIIGEIDDRTDWSICSAGVDCVVHLAARVHEMDDSSGTERIYDLTNHLGTLRLATEAVRYGVRHLVFLSTVKVNGDSSAGGAFRASDDPAPDGAYAVSKWRAEVALRRTARDTGLQVTIVRPPLVYGPNVRGNFLRLMRLVELGIPLPLASVSNRRSLVSVWNLCDLLLACVNHSEEGCRTLMVSDDNDLSTPELILGIAHALGRPARLFPLSPAVLEAAARALRRSAAIGRLCGTLQVDIEETRRRLSWHPPFAVDWSLAQTAAWYQATRKR